MKKRIVNYITIGIISLSLMACTNTKNENIIHKKTIDVNILTNSANKAIMKDNFHITEINNYLQINYPKIMKDLDNYDLRFDYKNNITTLLICKNDLALIEDFSCDAKVNNDYTNKKLPYNFYEEKPKCDR